MNHTMLCADLGFGNMWSYVVVVDRKMSKNPLIYYLERKRKEKKRKSKEKTKEENP